MRDCRQAASAEVKGLQWLVEEAALRAVWEE